MSDGSGLPLAFTLTPGQRHEVPAFGPTLKAVRLPNPRGRPTTRPKYLAGDKAYSYRPLFRYLRRRHVRPVIPPRAGGNMGKGCARAFDPDLYRRRNISERCVGWLKGYQSIATRHEKLHVKFAAMVKLASLRKYLRTIRPSDRIEVRFENSRLIRVGRRFVPDRFHRARGKSKRPLPIHVGVPVYLSS